MIMSYTSFHITSTYTPHPNIYTRMPEVFSCVLEYLYKEDYYPRLLYNKRHNSFTLEDAYDPLNLGGRGSVESTIYHLWAGGDLLEDTAIYCAAEKFGLEELKTSRPAQARLTIRDPSRSDPPISSVCV